MTLNLSIPTATELKPRILVFGVGGAGGNAVNNMISSQLEGVEFVVANTDAQSLTQSLAEYRIQLGVSTTQGLGAGSRPEIGRGAAEEAIDQIVAQLEGCHMCFITAGMGGGTGTGAGPVVARVAREMGLLTVGVVTKPFQFEGAHRMQTAESGIDDLQQYVDTLIVIPNQNLFRIANEKTTFSDAFKMADDVLHAGVRGVTDLMVMPGLINLDFADVRTVMSEMGKAMMGTGEGSGEDRAIQAAEAAISNPLLDDVSLKGARGVLINITGGYDLTLYELDEAANKIRNEVDQEANIIVGSTFDEKMEGMMRVSVVATGIDCEIERSEDLPSHRPMVHAVGGEMPVSSYEPTPIEATAPAAVVEEPVVQAVTATAVAASAGARPAPALNAAAAQPAYGVKPQETAPPVAPAPSLSDRNAPFVPAQPMPGKSRHGILRTQEPFAATREAKAVADGAPTEKREPSLFERITGTGRARNRELSGGAEPLDKAPTSPVPTETVQGGKTGATSPEPTVTSGEPLERMMSSRHDDTNLDIPAFLRRQAN